MNIRLVAVIPVLAFVLMIVGYWEAQRSLDPVAGSVPSKAGSPTASPLQNSSSLAKSSVKSGTPTGVKRDDRRRIRLRIHRVPSDKEITVFIAEEGSNVVSSPPRPVRMKAHEEMDVDLLSTTTRIVVSASDYISVRRDISPEENEIRIELTTRPVLIVRVHSEIGSISGAAVRVRSKDDAALLCEETADDRGVCEIPLPRSGWYEVHASHPLCLDSPFMPLHVVWSPFPIDIYLQNPSGVLLGTVTNTTHEAIPDATVKVRANDARTDCAETITNANGEYILENLPPGSYVVTVDGGSRYIAGDFRVGSGRVENALAKEAVITKHAPVHEVNFQLDNVVAAEGRVLDETDRPVRNALVSASALGAAPEIALSASEETRSGEQGEFRLLLTKRTKQFNTLRIRSAHPDYETSIHDCRPFDWSHDCSDLTIRMTRHKGTLHARVLDAATHRPVPNTAFDIVPYASQPQNLFRRSLKSDMDGLLEARLPKGHYLLVSPQYKMVKPAVIEMNDPSTLLEIVVRKVEGESATLKGVVLDTDQTTPVHGASVNLLDQSTLLASTLTGPDGAFETTVSKRLLDSGIHVRVSHRNYQDYSCEIHSTDDRDKVKIIVSNGLGAVRVRIGGHGSCSDYRLYLINFQTSELRECTDQLSQCESLIRNLDPKSGPYYVLAGNSSSLAQSEPIDFSQNPVKYFDLTLPVHPLTISRDIEFQLIDASSAQPVALAKCVIWGYTINEIGGIQEVYDTAISNAEGKAVFHGMGSFSGRISVSHGLYKPSSARIVHTGVLSGVSGFLPLDPVEIK